MLVGLYPPRAPLPRDLKGGEIGRGDVVRKREFEALLELGGHAIAGIRDPLVIGLVFDHLAADHPPDGSDLAVLRETPVTRRHTDLQVKIIALANIVGRGLKIDPTRTDIDRHRPTDTPAALILLMEFQRQPNCQAPMRSPFVFARLIAHHSRSGLGISLPKNMPSPPAFQYSMRACQTNCKASARKHRTTNKLFCPCNLLPVHNLCKSNLACPNNSLPPHIRHSLPTNNTFHVNMTINPLQTIICVDVALQNAPSTIVAER